MSESVVPVCDDRRMHDLAAGGLLEKRWGLGASFPRLSSEAFESSGRRGMAEAILGSGWNFLLGVASGPAGWRVDA